MNRPRLRTSLALVATVAAAALALAGCSASSSSGDTVTSGKLTIATGQPAYSPWVIDNKPQTGKGFEAAVSYAVAKEMGYSKSDVVWTRTTFDSAIAPGSKDWDMNIQQFSVTAKRKKAVDFSSSYYTTNQAVVTTKSSAAAKATTYAELKKDKIGVASGTTSLTVVQDKLGITPQVFNSNDDAVAALKAGQIDAVVTDLPTAFYISSSELNNGTVSAQFPAGGSTGDDFAFVLPKGSKLTPKVDKALAAIKKNGELASITKEWLSSETGAPVLK